MKQKLLSLIVISCVFCMVGCFETIQQTPEEKRVIYSPTDNDVNKIPLTDRRLNIIRRKYGSTRVNSTTQAVQSHNYSIEIGKRTKKLEVKTDELENETTKLKNEVKNLRSDVEDLKQKITPAKKPSTKKLKSPPV